MAYSVPNPKHETVSFRLQLYERRLLEGRARQFADGTNSTLLRTIINQLDRIMPILTDHQSTQGATHANNN